MFKLLKIVLIYVFYFSFRFQDIPCNKKEFKFSWNPCYAYTLPGTQCDSVAVSTVTHVRRETSLLLYRNV